MRHGSNWGGRKARRPTDHQEPKLRYQCGSGSPHTGRLDRYHGEGRQSPPPFPKTEAGTVGGGRGSFSCRPRGPSQPVQPRRRRMRSVSLSLSLSMEAVARFCATAHVFGPPARDGPWTPGLHSHSLFQRRGRSRASNSPPARLADAAPLEGAMLIPIWANHDPMGATYASRRRAMQCPPAMMVLMTSWCQPRRK